MDKDKQIQKIDKLSLKKLSEDSALAKRTQNSKTELPFMG